MNYKHGKSYTKTYIVWSCMKARCNNKKNIDYPNYVCSLQGS